MPAPHNAVTPSTRRALVVASLPALCAVCEGAGEVHQVKVRGTGLRRVRCPHCADHLPVVHLPMRRDTTSKEHPA